MLATTGIDPAGQGRWYAPPGDGSHSPPSRRLTSEQTTASRPVSAEMTIQTESAIFSRLLGPVSEVGGFCEMFLAWDEET